MGRDQSYGTKGTEAHSKQSSSKAKESRSRRSQSSPGDRGEVTEITKSTYYKERRRDMKKDTLKTLERELHTNIDLVSSRS
ncbi:hypothetical protein F2Q70_00026742 [Brassica cretica]|uniref:Uncharacterized protein n=1 Tax=Brassica cretica TaxID=69181 RepID=A0A8S9I802_BRACR|nr:hypothetical protein F2Q68_00026309 [Brassica cretica]KAF2603487.1 hypothetical protein F2Q70_00026742 [Brassica cretica]